MSDLFNIKNYARIPDAQALPSLIEVQLESFRWFLEEGLAERIARHERNHQMLRAGLEAMGLRYVPQHSLTTLNAVQVPEGVDDAAVRKRLLNEYNIEIGAGLGPFKGKAWRIGLMGSSSTPQNVLLILSALNTILRDCGSSIEPNIGIAAAGRGI